MAQETTMTLGVLIEKLTSICNENYEASVFYYVPERESPGCYEGIEDLFSWRGDYSSLCLEPAGTYGYIGVEQLLCKLRGAIGMTFHGYKGDDFLMDENTSVWKGWHGQCGVRYHDGIYDVTYDGDKVLIYTKKMGCW